MNALRYMRQAGANRRVWLSGLIASLSLMAAAVIISLFPQIDLTISGLFYKPGDETAWPAARYGLWKNINRHAGIFTAAFALGAMAVIAYGFYHPAWRRQRMHMVYVILVIALGPGLLVNGTFKQWWGRPRPKATAELGGYAPYRSLVQPGRPGSGRSFPCGHCSAAFSLVALYFVVRDRRDLRKIALAAVALAGGLMSTARIVSGAHFFTDALFSWGLVLFVAHGLYYFLLNLPVRKQCDRPDAMSPGPSSLAWTFALMVLVGVGGALATPYFQQLRYASRWHLEDGPVSIRVEMEKADVSIRFMATNRFLMTGQVEGHRGWFGKPKQTYRQTEGDLAEIHYTYRPVGRGVDLKTEANFVLPHAPGVQFDLVLREGRLRLHDPVHPAMNAVLDGVRLEAGEDWHKAGLPGIVLNQSFVELPPAGRVETEDTGLQPCCP